MASRRVGSSIKVTCFSFVVIGLVSLICGGYSYKPVVLLHGVLTGATSMELIADRITELHPGTKVYNIERFGGWSSLEPMWHQVQEIGNDIANISASHPDGIHLIGYSQGGLISRVILQNFLNHTVHNFISLSSPQGGQYGAAFLHLFFPGLVRDTAFELFYSRVGQHTAVGNYWNDPKHQQLFYNYSIFLPYVNNAIMSDRSVQFKEGLLKLKNMVLIGGPDDQVITPWQSSHFGYFDLNETVIDFESQDIYKKDLLGLKTLDKSGRLHVITVPGVDHFMWHLNVSIVDDYLLKFLD
ncbi:palmitoyl-protein thioesterase 2 [Arctopsyche grandis]|uniref:palmitoyl-protein thioesterase 2 n=1 Tax=Arctopsyche grandis TaxID=121162 RepID=UPI00406DA1CF